MVMGTALIPRVDRKALHLNTCAPYQYSQWENNAMCATHWGIYCSIANLSAYQLAFILMYFIYTEAVWQQQNYFVNFWEEAISQMGEVEVVKPIQSEQG